MTQASFLHCANNALLFPGCSPVSKIQDFAWILLPKQWKGSTLGVQVSMFGYLRFKTLAKKIHHPCHNSQSLLLCTQLQHPTLALPQDVQSHQAKSKRLNLESTLVAWRTWLEISLGTRWQTDKLHQGDHQSPQMIQEESCAQLF